MPNGRGNVYKIAVLGGEGSGKTALLVRFLTGRYIVEYDPTLEDTYRKIFLVQDEPESVDFLDTAARTGKSPVRQEFLEHGDGFVLVYSVTHRGSFEMVETFHQEITKIRRDHAKPYKVSLVGNKSDLEDARQVTKDEGEKLALQHGWSFCEASAAENTGISQAFFGLSCIPDNSPTHILGSENSTCQREKHHKKGLHKRNSHYNSTKFNIFRWHSQ